ncbi:MAG: tripartite tricarboxylate transporter substrate binding protein [Proteobacteria bacterium]|nr:tripartite tricarboxylate transporter substrate binding protein [Pseudomonadota bacterium]
MKNSLPRVLLMVAALMAGASWGQNYPNRAIRFVVPTAPGGGPDVIARFLTPKLTEILGQQVVVDNRAGANALIGADVVAKAPADGYTWLFGTGQNTVNPSILKSMPHDIIKDFAPVSLVFQAPYFLLVHPAVPVKSVKEFIAFAKANPNKLNVGSGGIGSAAHLSAELLQVMTGIKMVHVPYKGVGIALADLVGGHIDLMFPALASGLPYHKSGRLRGLGITSPKRHPSAPDVPAIAETVPKFEARSWIGVLVPAGTPREIVNRLNSVFVKLVNTPEVREQLIAQGVDPETNTPDEFAVFLRNEVSRAAQVVKAAGIKPE